MIDPVDTGWNIAVPEIGDDPAARTVIRAAIATSARRLHEELPRISADGDPEVTHRARVATRRLRSDLRTFAPLLDRAWAKGLRTELGWLADLMGEVRDADVVIEQVTVAAESCDGIDPEGADVVLAALHDRHAAHRDALVEALAGDRTRALLARVAEAAADPRTLEKADQPASRRLPRLVRGQWQRVRRAVEALDEEPTDAQLHDVRILAKRARYAAEATGPVCGRDARAFAQGMAGLQQTLGDLRDGVLAEDTLEELADDLDGPAAFTAGRIAESVRSRAAVHRRGWERAWRKASRKRLRSWF